MTAFAHRRRAMAARSVFLCDPGKPRGGRPRIPLEDIGERAMISERPAGLAGSLCKAMTWTWWGGGPDRRRDRRRGTYEVTRRRLLRHAHCIVGVHSSGCRLPAIGSIARFSRIFCSRFNPAPAVAFYRIFAAGLVILAVRPGLAEGSLRLAAGNGALLGFFAYATSTSPISRPCATGRRRCR